MPDSINPRADALAAMYSRLKSVYVTEARRQPPGGSVFCGLLDLSSVRRRMAILQKAAVATSAVDASEELVQEGFASFLETGTRIALTPQGVWAAESADGKIHPEMLLKFVIAKNFEAFPGANATLDEKEKVLLFSLLAARAFNKETGVNLRREESIDAWRQCVGCVAAFLRERGIIGDEAADEVLHLEQKQTTLKPLQHYFRYSMYLPKKTQNAFVASGSNYYLDLSEQGHVDAVRLTNLLELVVGHITLSQVEQILRFCREQAYDVATRAYEIGTSAFASSEYDRLMEKALRELALQV